MVYLRALDWKVAQYQDMTQLSENCFPTNVFLPLTRQEQECQSSTNLHPCFLWSMIADQGTRMKYEDITSCPGSLTNLWEGKSVDWRRDLTASKLVTPADTLEVRP